MTKDKTKSTPKFLKKLIGEVIGIAVLTTFSLISVPNGLTREAMITVGVLLWAICNWVFNCMADYIVAILMCTLFALFKVVPFATAFSGFSGSSWWLLIGALALGVAVKKSGLLNRVSLYILKMFPPTFNGQIMAMLGTGVIASPLIPSSTAKCSITAPIAMDIADQLGFDKHSRGRTGLFCSVYVGFALISSAFLSASFMSYVVLSVLPAEVQQEFTWLKWFISMIPWALVLLIGSYFYITRAYKPETNKKIPSDMIKKQLAALGKMSREEKITTIVLCVCLFFWIGESFIGIPAAISTLIAMAILLAFNVLETDDFHHQLMWPLIIFIGCIMGLGHVLESIGLTEYLAVTFGPALSFVANPYVLVTVVAVGVYLIRILIADAIAPITIFTVILTPIVQNVGINPWIVAVTAYVSSMVWYLRYMNVNFLAAFAAAGGDEQINFNDTVKMAFAYMVISLAGLLISVPYWQVIGLIK